MPLARFFFYLSGVVQTANEIREIIQIRSVVCVRYLLTTFCWHKVIGVEFPELYKKVANMLPAPDFTFLLNCNEQKRQERLLGRGLSYNDCEESKENRERLFLAAYRDYNLIEVDNSADDPTLAVQDILQRLNN